MSRQLSHIKSPYLDPKALTSDGGQITWWNWCMGSATVKLTAEKIAEFISEKISDGHKPAGDQDLIESGLVNSLGVMSLVKFIEQSEGISISAGDITPANFTNVNAIVAYVQTHHDT